MSKGKGVINRAAASTSIKPGLVRGNSGCLIHPSFRGHTTRTQIMESLRVGRDGCKLMPASLHFIVTGHTLEFAKVQCQYSYRPGLIF